MRSIFGLQEKILTHEKKYSTHEIKVLTHEKKNEKKKNPRKYETRETHERTRSMRFSRVSRQLLIVILN